VDFPVNKPISRQPEITVAQAYAVDERWGWLWYLGSVRFVRNKLGVRFVGEPWKHGKAGISPAGVRVDDSVAQKAGDSTAVR
jgi:hypothetical protein